MKLISNYNSIGDIVNINRTHKKHMGIGDIIGKKDGNIVESFASLLKKAVSKVNKLQVKKVDLQEKMAVSPNEVNIHKVMIATKEAEFSLNFLKAIRDRMIRAYQSIVNMR